jgi:hypothetical protein
MGPRAWHGPPFGFNRPLRIQPRLGVHPHRRFDGFRRNVFFWPFYPYYIPYVPYYFGDFGYAYDSSGSAYAEPDAGMEPPAPTIFERRTPAPPGAYAQPNQQREPAPEAAASPQPASEAPAPQVPTVLVFRDGRRLEVRNYAIVGPTLFNLSGGGPRKIALADLDLKATTQTNDDRGVEFSLPER